MNISFMTANFFARQAGYQLTEGWEEATRTTNTYFRGLDTFEARFGTLLAEIKGLGFTELDLWTEMLHPSWATVTHIAAAKRLLAHHGLTVTSLAGWFGRTGTEFEGNCILANTLGASVLGGNTGLLSRDSESLDALLEQHDLRFGYENHPEKTPEEVLARIRFGGERVGVALDTGWLGTQGYDAAQAIIHLAPRLMHVHLKDVRAVGSHLTCGFGQGVVPLEACVAALYHVGYEGAVSVEHEPESYDPSEEVKASKELLEGWLSSD